MENGAMSFFMANRSEPADEEPPVMTGPDLLQRVKKVRIGTHSKSKGEYSSRHTSVFRGCGIEYSDLEGVRAGRRYQVDRLECHGTP